jgi:hypothetical protein
VNFSNPYAPPASPEMPPQKAPLLDTATVPAGSRIAGALFVVNGFFHLLELAVVPADLPGAGNDGERGASTGWLGLVFDFIIGLTLVAKYPRLRTWAVVRVVLGAVAFTVKHAISGDMFSAAFQLIVTASFLVLLLGAPGKARIALGLALFAVYAAVEILGLASMART